MAKEKITNPFAGQPDVVVAIDPDAAKNGVAFLNRRDHHMEAMSLTFPLTLDYTLFLII